jgi:hypothetical protein
MKSGDLKRKLEHISAPGIPGLQHKKELKLAILSTRKSSRATFLLLLLPAVVLLEALCETVFHFLLPPWQWLVKYSYLMPAWLRLAIYATLLIVLPLVAAFLNILSIVWVKYDKEQKVLHISVRLKTANVIIIIITAAVGLLFIGHTVAEWITGAP